MTVKRVVWIASLALLAGSWASAQAGWRIAIGVRAPVYYRPYPYRVYVAPAPVYLAAPVYVQPAPVYLQPAPVYAPATLAPAPPAAGSTPPPPPASPSFQDLPPQPVPIR
jgi:hypothetical protein